MNPLLWLMRAKRWSQHPPSAGRVKLVFGVIALCLVVVGVEYLFGLPDWMALERLDTTP